MGRWALHIFLPNGSLHAYTVELKGVSAEVRPRPPHIQSIQGGPRGRPSGVARSVLQPMYNPSLRTRSRAPHKIQQLIRTREHLLGFVISECDALAPLQLGVDWVFIGFTNPNVCWVA